MNCATSGAVGIAFVETIADTATSANPSHASSASVETIMKLTTGDLSDVHPEAQIAESSFSDFGDDGVPSSMRSHLASALMNRNSLAGGGCGVAIPPFQLTNCR